MDHVRFADGWNVDQRADHLRISTSGDRCLSILSRPTKRQSGSDPPLHRLVWLVAMARITRDFLGLGNRGLSLGTEILRTRRDPRVSRPIRRDRTTRAPVAVRLLLFAALASQIFSMERVVDWFGDNRSSRAGVELSSVLPRNLAGDALVDLLGLRWPGVDVVDSIEAC